MAFETGRYAAPGETLKTPNRTKRWQKFAAKIALAGTVAIPVHARLDNYHPEQSNPPMSTEMQDALTNNPMYQEAHSKKPAVTEGELSDDYIVKSGDTLWSIARANNPDGEIRDEVEQMKQQLGGTTIQEGQHIDLPKPD